LSAAHWRALKAATPISRSGTFGSRESTKSIPERPPSDAKCTPVSVRLAAPQSAGALICVPTSSVLLLDVLTTPTSRLQSNQSGRRTCALFGRRCQLTFCASRAVDTIRSGAEAAAAGPLTKPRPVATTAGAFQCSGQRACVGERQCASRRYAALRYGPMVEGG
jgi:hypothetical protein